jgi:L-iditol 2-dehydrogenase
MSTAAADGRRVVAGVMNAPEHCRAAVMTAPGKPLEIVDVSVPQQVEAGAVLVQNDSATVCGTDVHLLEGVISPQAAGLNLPVILGHEMTGRIVAFGDGPRTDSVGQSLAEGDRIIWTHGMCGRCPACTVENTPMLCADFRRYMTGNCEDFPYLTGGFAEYGYVFPTSGRIRVPDEIEPDMASAASCSLRTVIRGFHRLGEIENRQTIVVQGAGPLGLFSVARAAITAAANIVVIGAPEARLDLARRWGATHTIDLASTTPAQRLETIQDITLGAGADVVLEMSGAPSAFTEGMNLVRRGGRYLIVGQSHSQTVPFNPSLIMRKHVTIIGSMSATIADFWEALDFMRRNAARFHWADMISGHYRLEDVNSAFERMSAFEEIKPALVFR